MSYYLRHPFFRYAAAAFALDSIVFLLAAAFAWSTTEHAWSETIHFACSGVGALLCFVALALCDGYRPENLMSADGTHRAVLGAMGTAFAAALLVHFLVPTPAGVTRALATIAAVYFPALTAERMVFRLLASSPPFSQRIVILGRSDVGVGVASAIRARGNRGVELVGFLSDDGEDGAENPAAHPVIGSVHELEKILDSGRVDAIIVASRHRDAYFPVDELLHAKLRGVHVESGVSFHERMTGRVFVRDLRPSYLVFSNGFDSNRLGEAVRRVADVVLAVVGLTLALPLLALAAIAIKLDSKGPVFYRQERVGRLGRPFQVLKLRTMKVDAELSGPTFTSEGDPRITRVGRFLRRTRLDEVPQYWNIIVGDMSIVGPRPERPEFMDVLTSRYPLFRLRVARKPGLTGWAQVRYGYVNDFEEFEHKLGLDLFYVKRRTLLLDLLIVVKTIKTVLLFRGL